MPRDRIKLADAKALIADGHATPESIAANFDIEDDGSADAAAPAPSRLETARNRVATPTLDRLGLTGADVKAGRGPQSAGIGAKVAGVGVDAVTGVADALGGLAGLVTDVATVAPRRSLAAAREFVRTRSLGAAYRASQNEPLLPATKVAGEASEDFRKTARKALGLDDSSETAAGPVVRFGTALLTPIPGMKARPGVKLAEEAAATTEKATAGEATHLTRFLEDPIPGGAPEDFTHAAEEMRSAVSDNLERGFVPTEGPKFDLQTSKGETVQIESTVLEHPADPSRKAYLLTSRNQSGDIVGMGGVELKNEGAASTATSQFATAARGQGHARPMLQSVETILQREADLRGHPIDAPVFDTNVDAAGSAQRERWGSLFGQKKTRFEPTEAAGETIPASEAGNAPATATSSTAINPVSAGVDFDAQAYVKEQVAAREAARRAGAPSGVLGKGRSLLADIKTKLVDSNAPIEDLLADTVKREKIKLAPSRDITNSIDRVYRAPSMAGQFARENGIEDVIKQVPDLDTLDQYLIAKQAATVEASGRATGRDLASDARFVDSQAAVYEPFAERIGDYSRKLLDYVTESGLVSHELADHLKKTYPDYVPLQRVFSEIENTGARGVGSGLTSISGQTVVRKLKGSQREIESPIESMMAKTTDAFTQGEKNKAGQLLANYRELPSNPFQIEEIVGEKIPTGAHTISYLDQGVKRTFTTTKEIAQAAKSLDVQRLGIVGRIFAAPVRVAKVGITGINPAFLVSNIAKDQITGFINSARGIATLGNPVTFSKALFTAVGHGELFDEMIREGALGTSFDMARNQIPATVASIRSTRTLATRAAYMTRHPSQLLRAAEDVLARGEEFTRIQHYIAGKQGAITQGLTEEEARIAGARAARENTVNFARRGEWGTVLNSGFMYLNAQIQGTRTLLRNLTSRPLATGAKIGTAVFLPVAIATAWNMKDPARRKAYEDVAEFEKENNIVLVPPEPTQDEKGRWRVIKIPLSQEINNLAKVPRRAIEQAFGSDPVRAGEIAEALAGTVSPIGTSKNQMLSTVVSNPAVKVPLEIHYNTNLFTGREIVPSSPGSRYRKELQTGGTARAIGRQLGMSPIDIEEAIRETFGGTGTQVLNLADQTTKVLSGNKDYPVGGESSLEATRRRFGLAFGGEVQRRQKQQATDAKEQAMQSMVK